MNWSNWSIFRDKISSRSGYGQLTEKINFNHLISKCGKIKKIKMQLWNTNFAYNLAWSKSTAEYNFGRYRVYLSIWSVNEKHISFTFSNENVAKFRG